MSIRVKVQSRCCYNFDFSSMYVVNTWIYFVSSQSWERWLYINVNILAHCEMALFYLKIIIRNNLHRYLNCWHILLIDLKMTNLLTLVFIIYFYFIQVYASTSSEECSRDSAGYSLSKPSGSVFPGSFYIQGKG